MSRLTKIREEKPPVFSSFPPSEFFTVVCLSWQNFVKKSRSFFFSRDPHCSMSQMIKFREEKPLIFFFGDPHCSMSQLIKFREENSPCCFRNPGSTAPRPAPRGRVQTLCGNLGHRRHFLWHHACRLEWGPSASTHGQRCQEIDKGYGSVSRPSHGWGSCWRWVVVCFFCGGMLAAEVVICILFIYLFIDFSLL